MLTICKCLCKCTRHQYCLQQWDKMKVCMAKTHKGNNELVTMWKTLTQQPSPPLKDGIKPWFYSTDFSLCEPVVSSKTPSPGRRMCDGCYCRLADRSDTSGLLLGTFCRWPWKGNSANCSNWTPAPFTGLVFVVCAGGCGRVLPIQEHYPKNIPLKSSTYKGDYWF